MESALFFRLLVLLRPLAIESRTLLAVFNPLTENILNTLGQQITLAVVANMLNNKEQKEFLKNFNPFLK